MNDPERLEELENRLSFIEKTAQANKGSSLWSKSFNLEKWGLIGLMTLIVIGAVIQGGAAAGGTVAGAVVGYVIYTKYPLVSFAVGVLLAMQPENAIGQILGCTLILYGLLAGRYDLLRKSA